MHAFYLHTKFNSVKLFSNS